MRRILVVIGVLAIGLGGCKGKQQEAGSAGSSVAAPAAPVACPPGNVVDGDKCVAVVTPEKIAAVAAQQTRLDELAKLLDQVDVVAAPVELLDGVRQLPAWQTIAGRSDVAKTADQVVATLNLGVKKLRELKGHLGEASQRLGNLKGELDQLMTSTGAGRQLAEVRGKISGQLRGALEPLAGQLQDTIEHALAPLAEQLATMADLVIGGCAMAKLSGGGDKLAQLCANARGIFDAGTKFIDDFKAKPAQLFGELTGKLEAELDQLVDGATKQALDAAQRAVTKALALPAGSASR
jgi:hypothetical protein